MGVCAAFQCDRLTSVTDRKMSTTIASSIVTASRTATRSNAMAKRRRTRQTATARATAATAVYTLHGKGHMRTLRSRHPTLSLDLRICACASRPHFCLLFNPCHLVDACRLTRCTNESCCCSESLSLLLSLSGGRAARGRGRAGSGFLWYRELPFRAAPGLCNPLM